MFELKALIWFLQGKRIIFFPKQHWISFCFLWGWRYDSWFNAAQINKSLASTSIRDAENQLVWRDIRPSMVTHTWNLCSTFNPSKVHTHSSEHTHTHCEHTPGAVGSHFCCGTRGAVGGSVPCSRAPQLWYWRWRERCTFTPPTYNSCRPETRTHNLSITSPTL